MSKSSPEDHQNPPLRYSRTPSMRKRLFVTLVTISSIVSVSLAFYVLPDDKELLIEPDINLHKPITDECIENYNKLAAILESGTEFTWLVRPEIDATAQEYNDFLQSESQTIISNYSLAEAFKSDLIDIAGDGCIASPITHFNDPITSVGAFRNLCYAYFDYWELCGLREDLQHDSSDILIPYAIALNWMENNRTLIETLTCIAVMKKCYHSIERGHANTSKKDLEPIELFLKAQANAAENTADALIAEYCTMSSAFELLESQIHPILVRLTYKRNKTYNIYASNLQKQLELAKEHDWEGLEELATSIDEELNSFHLRNWGGWQFLRMAMPKTNKFLKIASDLDEQREELLSEVQGNLTTLKSAN